MRTCLFITNLSALIMTALVIVAFATPNWLEFFPLNGAIYTGELVCFCNNCSCGLWVSCGAEEDCAWFFENSMAIEDNLPDWFKAVQGLYSCAVASSILALIIGLCALCCYCQSCNPHHAAGAFINLTFLLLAVAVCVFGSKAYLDHDAHVFNKDTETFPLFGWSFWLAACATVMSLVSSVCYFCLVRQDDYYV